ncbi:MFS transporter [Chitinophaga caseinilytica]|uniref:MFS transporter n=1 Tax=Chitinophaga caseinilytica TaxID=2267521 RepID=A0ABZ2YZH8_9BACT
MSTYPLSSPTGRNVMAATILASSMAFIDGTALNVVLPSLQNQLQATAAGLFWVLNAYLLMLAALILVGGALGDRLGRKRVFMTGILIFIAGSAACGLAGTVEQLVLFRVLQGGGGALMIPGSLSLLSSSVDENEKGKAIGTWSAFTTLVTMGGPVLGGALADAGLWRYIFFINVPLGLVSLLILRRHVPEQRDASATGGIDYLGGALTALGLASLTFGFLRMPEYGFSHWQSWGAIAAGVLLLAAFIVVEIKSPYPMLPLQLFRNRTFSGANLLTFFLYAALGTGMLFLSLNMVQVQGYSQLQSGLTFLPFTVLMILLARPAGSWADKTGPRPFLVGGPLLAGTGLFLMSLVGKTAGPSAYWTTFFPGILVLGLGMSFTVAPLTATVMGSLQPQLSGTASGVNNAVTRIASVFATAIFGALAVLLFAKDVRSGLDAIVMNESLKTAVVAETTNLGNAHPPGGVPAELTASVKALYKEGFTAAYQKILLISAIMGWLSGIIAWWMIPKKKSTPR